MSRVLIIDDAVSGTDEITNYIDSLPPGTEVVHFQNGVAAIHYLKSVKDDTSRVDLVLLDQNFDYGSAVTAEHVRNGGGGGVHLTDISALQGGCDKMLIKMGEVSPENIVQQQGLIILAALKRYIPKCPPVIFCCAQGSSAIGRMALDGGATDYISKSSFKLGALSKMLLKVLPLDSTAVANLIKEISDAKGIEFDPIAQEYFVAACGKCVENVRQYVSDACAALLASGSRYVTLKDVDRVVLDLSNKKKILDMSVPIDKIRAIEARLAKLKTSGFGFIQRPNIIKDCNMIVSEISKPTPSCSAVFVICGRIIEQYAKEANASITVAASLDSLTPPLPVAGIGKIIWGRRNLDSHSGYEYTKQAMLVVIDDIFKFIEGVCEWEKKYGG